MKRLIVAALIGSAMLAPIGMSAFGSAEAQVPVFDGTNYAQNLLIAARTLEQVNHQIEELQNQAVMLSDMAKHLEHIDFPEIQQLQQKMQEIDALMGKAQGLNFKVSELDKQYSSLFPANLDQALSSDQRIAAARARLEAAVSQFHEAMGVQSEIVENVRNDAGALSRIVDRSQASEGSLQAAQATNQLLALAAKQQFQLQELMAAQFRSDSIEQSSRAQSELEGREATRRFLGNGKAYTPK